MIERPTGISYINFRVAVCPADPNYGAFMNMTNSQIGSDGYAMFYVGSDSAAIFASSGLQTVATVPGPLPDGAASNTVKILNLNRLPTSPSETILMGDSLCEPSGDGYEGSGNRYCIGDFCDRGNGGLYAGRIFTAHGYATWKAHNTLTGVAATGQGAANVAFFDGHCESLAGADLYNDTQTHLQRVWDKNWQDIQFP
jgi:prepilin-type processing-associated H-X9-DG protein